MTFPPGSEAPDRDPRAPAWFPLAPEAAAPAEAAPRPPRAIPLAPAHAGDVPPDVRIIMEPDAFAAEAELPAPPPPRTGLTALLLTLLGFIVTLALGLAADELVRSLEARAPWLGWVGLVLVLGAALALAALLLREALALFRLRHLSKLRQVAAIAATERDVTAARRVVRQLQQIYDGQPLTAQGRHFLTQAMGDAIDAPALLIQAEQALLLPLDEAAERLVIATARQTALVTAVSPRAVVDVLFVTTASLRLIRRIAMLYGGRPGALGFWRLTRLAFAHVAVTGSLALGDSLVQQVLGHGLTARLSAKLGEGVINGLMCARLGAAAIELCRPLPYEAGHRLRMSTVMTALTRTSGA